MKVKATKQEEEGEEEKRKLGRLLGAKHLYVLIYFSYCSPPKTCKFVLKFGDPKHDPLKVARPTGRFVWFGDGNNLATDRF